MEGTTPALISCKIVADFSVANFSKYFAGSSYSTYLPGMVLFFLRSCPNWLYCKLGTKKFLPSLLIFFHQLRHSITGKHIRKGCFFEKTVSTISAKLFLALEMTPNCTKAISKQGYSLWRKTSVRNFPIDESQERQ